MNPHAEVERVDVGDDGIRIRGVLVGDDDSTQLLARRRSDGHEVTVPVALDGPSFEATVPLEALAWRDDDEPDFWDLYIGQLRLGRHRDGVADKRHAYVFPTRCRAPALPALLQLAEPPLHPHRPSQARQGPHATAVGSCDAPPRHPATRAGRAPPHAQARRHRPARRPRAAAPKITILIANAYGMGGTIRTCLNVAGYLAQRHEVEVISVHRQRDRPFFPFPPGVKVRVVDDLRDRPFGGRAGRIRDLLRPHRSRLVYPGDLRFARGCSLWTDLLLLRHLWTVRGASSWARARR